MWSLDNSLPYSDDATTGSAWTIRAGLREMAAAVAVSNAGGPMSTLPPRLTAGRGGADSGAAIWTPAPTPSPAAGSSRTSSTFSSRDADFCLVYCWAVGTDGIEVPIPRSLVHTDTIDFKWSDNCFARGDWTDFGLNGDAAPNDRYDYRAVLR